MSLRTEPGVGIHQIPLRPQLTTMIGSGRVKRPAQRSKYYAYTHTWLPLAQNAVNVQSQFIVDAQTDHFAVQKIAVLADNYGAKIRVTASPNQEQFMFEQMFLTHFGSGLRQKIVDTPWPVRKNSVIVGWLSDFATQNPMVNGNNVRIVYHGAKVYPYDLVPERIYDQHREMIYNLNFTAQDSGLGALAANESRIYSTRTDPIGDFEIRKVTICSDGPVTIQITTVQDDWFQTDLRSETLGGSLIELVDPRTGEYPFILPAPRFVGGGMSITARVTNQINAANRCEAMLHGVRLYPAGGL